MRLLWLPEIPEPSSTGEPTPLVLDQDLLWVLPTGHQNVHATMANINSLGLRGPELGEKDGPRLMTLGDSSIFGHAVADDQSLDVVAAEILGIEAVNGAMPGYSSLQAEAVLERVGETVRPDIVVIGTLWSDNNFDSFVDSELRESHRGRGPARLLWAVRRHSAFVRWLSPPPKPRQMGFGSEQQSPSLGRRRVSVGDYVANLDALTERTLALGGEPLFLMLANDTDVMGRPGPFQWDPYRNAMRDAAARSGCPIVELSEYVHGRQDLLLDEMHPSVAGHRLIGELVAKAVQTTGWSERGLCGAARTSPAVVWDPWEGDPPPQADTAGQPTLAGVLWVDDNRTRGAEVVATTSSGRRFSTSLPARSAFGFVIEGDSVQVVVRVEDVDGRLSDVDFGALQLPAHGYQFDLDEGTARRVSD